MSNVLWDVWGDEDIFYIYIVFSHIPVAYYYSGVKFVYVDRLPTHKTLRGNFNKLFHFLEQSEWVYVIGTCEYIRYVVLIDRPQWFVMFLGCTCVRVCLYAIGWSTAGRIVLRGPTL